MIKRILSYKPLLVLNWGTVIITVLFLWNIGTGVIEIQRKVESTAVNIQSTIIRQISGLTENILDIMNDPDEIITVDTRLNDLSFYLKNTEDIHVEILRPPPEGIPEHLNNTPQFVNYWLNKKIAEEHLPKDSFAFIQDFIKIMIRRELKGKSGAEMLEISLSEQSYNRIEELIKSDFEKTSEIRAKYGGKATIFTRKDAITVESYVVMDRNKPPCLLCHGYDGGRKIFIHATKDISGSVELETNAVLEGIHRNLYMLSGLAVVYILLYFLIAGSVRRVEHQKLRLEENEERLEATNKKLEEAVEIQKARTEELRISEELVTKSNHQMAEELRLAGEVQRSTIHRPIPIAFLDTQIIYSPFGEVSGDVYDFSLNREGELNIFLGDAMGHGVAAAFLTVMVQIGVDSIRSNLSTHESMRQLNRTMSLRKTGYMITGVWLRLRSDGCMTTTNAGHPPIFVISKSGKKHVFSQEGGLPLGIYRRDVIPYTEQEHRLEPGDKVVIYSDGITEWQNPRDELFGVERLIRVVKENRHLDIARVKAKLVEELELFSEGTPCNDDLTVILLEYLGNGGKSLSNQQ